MSNESQSPPLRLKPRLSSAQPVPTPENPPANPAPASTPANGPAAPLPTPVAPAPLRTVIPAPLPPEPVPVPVSAKPAAPPPAEDPGKFKLKPRGAAPVAAASAAAPANPSLAVSAPAVPSAAMPAPAPAGPIVAKPTLPAAALASPAFAQPPPPALPGRPNMPIAPLPPSGPVAMPTGGPGPRPQGKMVAQNNGETEAARGKFALKLLMALLFVAFVLGGVFAYNLWFSEGPAPAPVAAKPVPAPKPVDVQPVATSSETAPAAVDANNVSAPTPAPAPVVVDNPQSALGQQVAKAQAAVAAHDAALSQPVDDLLKQSATATAPVGQAAAPATATLTPAEPDAVVTPPAEPAPAPVVRPEPSAAFKSFVVNLKVNGVFQGENARAMINGKMYRLGEVVDGKLGIVFLRLEPENKRIVFEDSKGAIMSRRY